MEQSLFSAQVRFVDDRLALIHIPLDVYPFFLQPILQLLFHDVPPMDSHSTNGHDSSATTLPAFLNISVTPVECSVVCSRVLANRFFVPLLQSEPWNASSSTVQISAEDFIVMQVDGQGLDAGQRVLELTSPLAMAGVSIFFISTYFSDYILFPRRARKQVTQALESRGFHFEAATASFTNNSHGQFGIAPSPVSPSPPRTPPPSSLAELQARTFESLRRHNVCPLVDKTLQIIQCAVHYREPAEPMSYSALRPSLISTLLLDKPRFLSLTVTATDPSASILLEKRLLPRFCEDADLASSSESILLGSSDDVLIPMILDLRNLPVEATGIVCGVAGKMASASHTTVLYSNGDGEHCDRHVNGINGSLDILFDSLEGQGDLPRPPPSTTTPELHLPCLEPVEISFLSTARAGTVIVSQKDIDRAMASLNADSRHAEALGRTFKQMKV